jgi:hypothetical protein
MYNMDFRLIWEPGGEYIVESVVDHTAVTNTDLRKERPNNAERWLMKDKDSERLSQTSKFN